MPMWRCPHCGTPQAETARCWVCRRSSTACATCRNFRHAIAGQLGYCGLDRQRRPLVGSEIRACWEAGVAPVEVVPTPGQHRATAPLHVVEDRTPVRKLEFVEVGSVAVKTPRRRGRPAGVAGAPADAGLEAEAESALTDEPPIPVTISEPGWSLWSDAEV